MIGTFMGATYLIIEMVKQKAMHKATKAILIYCAIFLAIVEGFLYFLYSLDTLTIQTLRRSITSFNECPGFLWVSAPLSPA